MRIIRNLLVAALLVPAMPAAAVHDEPPPSHDRIYLLGTQDDDFLYWSVDRDDPELQAGRVERFCSAARPQSTPGYERCEFFFLQATRLHAPATWNATKPLRYHLALEVETPGTFTVHLRVNDTESSPAVEVAPGIWEGTMSGGSLQDSGWNTISLEVKRQVDHGTISLKTGGASYVDLPTAVPSEGVPTLLAQSPGPKEGLRSFQTDTRKFTFLDDEWSVRSFEADLQQTRTFDVSLERDALFVLGWVEVFQTPFVHDVLRGRAPDSRKLTDSAQADLMRDGQRLSISTNPGLYGMGVETVLAMDVPAGPLQLQIDPTKVFAANYQQGSPYKAHVLAVYGDRTLSSMRWTGMFADYPGLGVTQAPMVARCPGYPTELVPMTPEATSVAFELNADSVSPIDPTWTFSFLLPPNSWLLCGEVSMGDDLRFTFPFTGIHRVGPVLADDKTYTEYRDTVFEFGARFSYTPRPEPEHEPQG